MNSPAAPFERMLRLLEDDVTPETVEAHIADYEASLGALFPPAQLECLKPIREQFYQAVREFAHYDNGREVPA
jgi:hypothetical protein